MRVILTLAVDVEPCTRHGEDGTLPDAEEIRQDLAEQCADMLIYQHKDGNEHLCVVESAEVI